MEFSGQYLTYNEYKAMGGDLDQAPFNILELEARKEIDQQTLGRLMNLKEQRQETKACVFALINLFNSINNGVEMSGNVINYDNNQILQTKNDIIMKYLLFVRLDDGTPYLYRGV